tara:strand:- start:12432 stop:13331 length:900 start_codon:yes stop_codon:yes gene_type:complete
MNVSSASSNLSLKATVSATRPGYIGAVAMDSGGKTSYADADYAYKTYFLIVGASSVATLNLATGDATGTAWTSPVHQVETATAVGTVTTAGDATITVTAAGLTGSPLAISVAVALSDTPTLWAAKVRTALAADAAVGAMFDISGATDAIILTRKAKASYVVGTDTYDIAYANDATLNVAIANDTSVGITADATSTNTTAAVVATGVTIWNDDIDFEGRSLASPSVIYALGIEHSTLDEDGQTANYTIGTEYSGRVTSTTAQSSTVAMSYPDAASILDPALAITVTSETGVTVVTVIGKE